MQKVIPKKCFNLKHRLINFNCLINNCFLCRIDLLFRYKLYLTNKKAAIIVCLFFILQQQIKMTVCVSSKAQKMFCYNNKWKLQFKKMKYKLYCIEKSIPKFMPLEVFPEFYLHKCKYSFLKCCDKKSKKIILFSDKKFQIVKC